jgi:hypothetical protein
MNFALALCRALQGIVDLLAEPVVSQGHSDPSRQTLVAIARRLVGRRFRFRGRQRGFLSRRDGIGPIGASGDGHEGGQDGQSGRAGKPGHCDLLGLE